MPRSSMSRVMAMCVFESTSPELKAGSGNTELSNSSSRSHPPGFKAAIKRVSTCSRSGTCSNTNRECTRSKAESGKGSVTILWQRTSVFASFNDSRKRGSISVTRTCPVGPTRAASQAAMEPPPPPTSRQRQPGLTPRPSKWRMVPRQNQRIGLEIGSMLLYPRCRECRATWQIIDSRGFRYSSQGIP